MSFSPQEIAYEEAHAAESQGPALIAGSVALVACATLAVILRLVARRVRKISLHIDDYMVIVALFLAYGEFVALIFCIHYGLGRHILVVGLENAVKSGRALYVLEAIYPACTATTKISILLLYWRIFALGSPYIRKSIYILSGLIVTWAIGGFFTTVFQCWPVHNTWDHQGGRCINLVTSLITLATLNTALNAAVLVLPMPAVWKLAMSRSKRLGICGIFALGCGDVVSGIIRIYMTSQLTLTDVDLTWLEANATLLGLIDPCVGIVCCCLPVLRSLGDLRGMFSRPLRSSERKSPGFSAPSVSRDVRKDGTDARYSYLESKGGWIELREHGQTPSALHVAS